MDSQEIRQRFLDFFRQQRHEIVASSSLMPDDPSVLLTTAGMQQFKPYLTGSADPVRDFGTKTVFSFQKCFRTTDIDEVGDDSHLTFFEMAGNFSFGDYFKERAILLSFEFITSVIGIDPKRLFVTAFKGDDEVPRDDEAIKLWQEQFKKVGIDAKIGERIFLYGREKNWWEAGVGPAGPDAEMFYDFGNTHDPKFGPECHPNCDCGRFVEIGNDVFVQYSKILDGKYEPLRQKSIDNGRGFERIVMIMQGKKNIFETDLFSSIMDLLPEQVSEKQKRIMADHLRGIVFLLADGIRPSNKDRGYILRRLMRRVFVYENINKLDQDLIKKILEEIINQYGVFYAELTQASQSIFSELNLESEAFKATLSRGLKELEKKESINGQTAFDLYQSFGLPYEIIKELGGDKAADLTRESFDKELQRHQEISRAGAEKKFGGHGMASGDLTAANEEELKIKTRLHTATHLLNAALRKVLGDSLEQRGSDITAERIRFDFLFPRKLTPEEIQETENLVKQAISNNYPVTIEEMDLDQAKNSGALFFFKGNYPAKVKVYTIGGDLSTLQQNSGQASSRPPFSRELCGGPHLKSTGEIGHFRIIKEESSSSGVRRIRAIVE